MGKVEVKVQKTEKTFFCLLILLTLLEKGVSVKATRTGYFDLVIFLLVYHFTHAMSGLYVVLAPVFYLG